MPTIAIKQTLSDQGLQRGLSESINNIRAWGREAQRVFNETRTPLERYMYQADRLQHLHKIGLISTDTYNRALRLHGSQVVTLAENVREKVSTLGQQISAQSGIPALAAVFIALRSPTAAIMTIFAAAASAAIIFSRNLRELRKEAATLGVSFEAFLKLSHVARVTGVDVNNFTTAMLQMERRLGEAAINSGPAESALKELGISVTTLLAMSPEAAFVRLAESVMTIENRFQRARLEMELFGRSGAGLDQMLRVAAQGLEKFAEKIPAPEHLENVRRLAPYKPGPWLKRVGAAAISYSMTAVDIFDKYTSDIYDKYVFDIFDKYTFGIFDKYIFGFRSGWKLNPLVSPEAREALEADLQARRQRESPTEEQIERVQREINYERAREMAEEAERLAPERKTPLEKIDALLEQLKQWGMEGQESYERIRRIRERLLAEEEEKERKRLEELREEAREAMERINREKQLRQEAEREHRRSVIEQFERFEQQKRWRKEGFSEEAIRLFEALERGVPIEKILPVAQEVAQLEALQRISQSARLAPNIAFGSQEAYEIIARARQPDQQKLLADEIKNRLDAIKGILGQIKNKIAMVAEVP